MKKKYKINVDCANCARKMQDAINKLEGVEKATINFMMAKLIVEYKEDSNEEKVLKEILKTCKKIDSDIEID